jgi:hypothetical protein|tara:strand:- start:991 stop:1389 length:399 start_codon:yes stop_codon:yes gene_type:complete
MKEKKGNILVENIIFIVLNLIFLTILFLFLFSKVGDAAVLEEKYAKQIALMIDSAKPGMEIHLNMEKALKKKEDSWNFKNVVSINDNIVTVKLRENGGYSYSFFNDVELENPYPIEEDTKYRFKIIDYKKNE